jgi:hypothetical protein
MAIESVLDNISHFSDRGINNLSIDRRRPSEHTDKKRPYFV